MAWYATGDIDVTNGSTAVVGNSTAWNAAINAGDALHTTDGRVYEIASVNSNTSLTLATAYQGSTLSGQNYSIQPTRGVTVELVSDTQTLLSSFQSVADNAGTGKFAAGTAGAPSLRGSADQDSGFNFEGSNVIGISVGGSKVGQIAATDLRWGNSANAAHSITVLTSNAGAGTLYFGDAASATAGRVTYDHSAQTMAFFVEGTSRASLSATYLALTGGLKVKDEVLNTTSTSSMTVSSDTTAFTGATLRLFGATHATQANDFQIKQGTTNVLVFDFSADNFIFYNAAGTAQMVLSNGTGLRPNADNVLNCGAGSFRWAQIYAANGTINTSDERLKTDIEDVDAALLRAWSRVRARTFRWIDAVEAKGDGARTHVGFIAQHVADAFEAEGLDPTAFALFCVDKVLESRTRPIDPADPAGGEEIYEHDTGEVRLGLRMTECLALECAYQRSVFDRVTALAA